MKFLLLSALLLTIVVVGTTSHPGLKKGYKGSKKQKRENWTWNGKEKNDLNLDVVEQGDTKQETEADEEVDMITIAELIWEKRDAGVIEEEEEGEKGEEINDTNEPSLPQRNLFRVASLKLQRASKSVPSASKPNHSTTTTI
ncbi:uncharacterized protein [Procambarus clarkii]|uniref:uncharacterized protein n=1 Tax=Procambarus clarkii TaxID=6728 RepID=UPI0037442174